MINLSRQGDTTSFYPDTVLVLSVTTDIPEQGSKGHDFAVTECFPNPGEGWTTIRIRIPGKDQLRFVLMDDLLRTILSAEYETDEGLSSFRLKTGSAGVFFLITAWGNRSDMKGIINVNQSTTGDYRFEKTDGPVLQKETPGHTSGSFQFVPGDVIWNRGFSLTSLAGILDMPASNSDYTFLFVPASPCPGLPTIFYGGQTYHTILLGDQCWLGENLNIGSMIDVSQDQINNSVLEKYCYDNDPLNCTIYGGLYQWDEAMQYVTSEGAQGMWPAGWHIPSAGELTSLETFLGGMGIAGSKMKEMGIIHWEDPNTGATNESGLSALPAGNSDGVSHAFSNLVFSTNLWSSTLTLSTTFAVTRGMSAIEAKTSDNLFIRPTGFSVRYLKD